MEFHKRHHANLDDHLSQIQQSKDSSNSRYFTPNTSEWIFSYILKLKKCVLETNFSLFVWQNHRYAKESVTHILRLKGKDVPAEKVLINFKNAWIVN